MRTLKELADLGHTVVASIHQPRSSIYALFDDLILLSEGSIVYSGPAEGVLGHFASLGHTCPEHYNPAEFLADLIAIDHDSPEAEAASKARLAQLVGAWEEKAGGAAHHQQHMKRSASGIKALGRGRRRPVVGWGR
jgi:ABC-type multidrug transport system ATPase subunit